MTSRRSCAPLAVLVLAACITSQWQKTGAPPSQWALDEAACHRQAQGVGDHVYAMDQFNRPQIGYDPAEAWETDEDEADAYQQMNATFTECMRNRGYHLTAVRQ